VEAALIAALGATPRVELFNRREEVSELFRPLGIPVGLGLRQKERVTLSEIGRRVGGALVVRIGPGRFGDQDRAKFDPLAPSDSVIAENVVRWWDLCPLLAAWRQRPQEVPHVILGAAGPPNHRYIPAAMLIDRVALAALELDARVAQVPVQADLARLREADLDAGELRGCIIADALFGRLRVDHVIWVDAQGALRYATSPRMHARLERAPIG